MAMKLSFNTWPYSSFPVWLPAYTLEETIKRIKKIGYDGIEIGAASPHCYPPTLSKQRRKDIGKMLKDYDLELSSMLPALSGGPGHNVCSPIPEERRHTIEHLKDLAQLLGASRQRVNQELKSFERDGAVRVEPTRLVVLDSAKLLAAAGK